MICQLFVSQRVSEMDRRVLRDDPFELEPRASSVRLCYSAETKPLLSDIEALHKLLTLRSIG